MTPFENKLVAVMNEKLDAGVAMNALAHMGIGIGGMLGKEDLYLNNYNDADGGVHPSISDMPFIILKANSNKIRTLRQSALEKKCAFVDFTSTMTIGTYVQQHEATAKTKEADLVYYGIILYGAYEVVGEMTRKFSLWK